MSYPTKMAPNHHPHHFMLHGLPLEPVSRTYQYRKIMKPMLERKRRARINKCLDELKDLMTSTLQADGENLSKLEKADILELTVRHLHRLRETNGLFVRHTDTLNMEKFWAGFQHCAVEVSHFLQKYEQQNKHVNGDLIKYIASYVPNMAAAVAAAAATTSATTTPPTAHMPPQSVVGQLPPVGCRMTNHLNEHYQKFGTAPRQHPAEAAAAISRVATAATTATPQPPLAAAATATQQHDRQHPAMQISASAVSNFERIWEAAARAAAANGKQRMHPYTRKALHNHSNNASGGADSMAGGDESDEGGDCGDADYPASDGLVWRPW